MADYGRLEQQLGHTFSDRGLLKLALTHRSAAVRNNERLEFLGDSIVNHIIAQSLYQRFPAAREGEMSRMRATLVKGDTLAEIAAEIGLGEFLNLGSGERKSGGHRRGSILADALEAVAGAILLDSDVGHCRDCVLNWFAPRLEQLSPDTAGKDPKTRLQEYLQGRGHSLPLYQLLEVTGEAHKQVFRVRCAVPELDLACEGQDHSRRKAEQDAAAATLAQLGR
jgi:ribonuclease-3